MKASDLPNLITMFRIVLIAPIVWAMIDGRYDIAIWLFLVAGVSDAADGFIAKRYGWTSEFGGQLDAAADKLLLISGFLTVWWLELVPLWLLVVVFIRDLVIVAGIAIYHFHFERVGPQPSVLSKVNTFTQVVCILLVLLGEWRGGMDPSILANWYFITLLTTVFSGLGYLWTFSRRAWRLSAGRR